MNRNILGLLLALALLAPMDLAAQAARSPANDPAGLRAKQSEELSNLREAQHRNKRSFQQQQRQEKKAYLKQLAGEKRLTKKERQLRIKEFNLKQKSARVQFRNTQQAELSR